MSEVNLTRRPDLQRAGDILRRIGRALWFLLKGAGLGLGWCVALFLALMLILGAGQPDAAVYSWFDTTGRNDSPMEPHLAVATTRAAFIVGGLLAMIGTYQLSQAFGSWWAKLWGETP